MSAIREAETQYEVTVKEAETHHTTEAHDLEQSHKESVLKLECKALVEEGHDHQTFVEACGTAVWACPAKAHGALMYPLLLLTGDVPLAAMLAATLQLATVHGELPLIASPPTVSRTLAPTTRTKWWHPSSDQEATDSTAEKEEAAILDVSPEEHPHQRWKERRPLSKIAKESHQEAFKKDSKLVQSVRQAYFQMHHANYNLKGSQYLCHTFQKMAPTAHLVDSEICEVWEVWTGQKDL